MTEWRAQPKQRLFLRAPEREVLYGGAAGGGKTDALLIHGIRVCAEYPGAGGLFFRRTFKDLMRPGGAIPRSHELLSGVAQWRGDEHKWQFPNGSVFQFSHMESATAYLSHRGDQLGWLIWDELTAFHQHEYDYLRSRMRTMVPGLETTIRAGSNPGDIGHAWVKQTWIDNGTAWGEPFVIPTEYGGDHRTARFIPARVEDNQELVTTNPGYVDELNSLPEDLRRAFRDGDWNVFKGQFFTEWRGDKHMCRLEDLPLHWQDLWPRRMVSVDFGMGAPWSAHFYVRDETAWAHQRITRWYVYRELYGPNVRDVDQARRIREAIELDWQQAEDSEPHFVLVADPSMWNRTPNGASIADVYQAEGVPISRGVNDRLSGWQRVREYLADQADGLPAVRYLDSCRHAIRTIPNLVYDATRVEDLDTTGEDHAADDLRYFAMAAGPLKPKPAPRPQKFKMSGGARRMDDDG